MNLVNIFILFIKRIDSFLYIYIDYYSLNKIIIKNYYFLLKIDKILNYLIRSK
jgi:hypothetical protein